MTETPRASGWLRRANAQLRLKPQPAHASTDPGIVAKRDNNFEDWENDRLCVMRWHYTCVRSWMRFSFIQLCSIQSPLLQLYATNYWGCLAVCAFNCYISLRCEHCVCFVFFKFVLAVPAHTHTPSFGSREVGEVFFFLPNCIRAFSIFAQTNFRRFTTNHSTL